MILKKNQKPLKFVATDDIKSNSGKEIVLKSMSNHYRTLLNIKPQIKIENPKKNALKHKTNLSKENEFYNVRQTYKSIINVKPSIDNKKPLTYDMTRLSKINTAKEKFEDMEHIRRLDAMSKRMAALGKTQDRKKNKFDPISNPTYFFKSDSDEKGIKLVKLDNFKKKIHEMNNKFLDQPKRVKSAASLKGVPNLPINSKNDVKFTNLDLGINPNFFIYTNPDVIIQEHIKERKIMNILHDKVYIDQKINIHNSCLTNEDNSKIENKDDLRITNNFNLNIVTKKGHNEISIKGDYQNKKISAKNKSNILNQKSKMKNQKIFSSKGLGKLEIYKNKDLVDQIPLYEFKPDAKEDFQNRIVKHLFSNRIYKNKDLAVFLKLLINKNKNIISENEITYLYKKVIESLDE